MSVYFTAERITTAIESLSTCRAKSALLDFLIVKRVLKITGVATPIAQSEAAFLKALDELASCGALPAVGAQTPAPVSPEKPYINPFATSDSKSGYRSAKFKSNGTNSTIAGNQWQNVVSLSEDEPRKASLKQGYESNLERLLLNSNERDEKPRLDDLAAWYFRARAIAVEAPDNTRLEHYRSLVRQVLLDELALTRDEIDALFSEEDVPLTPEDVGDQPPDPRTYLPGMSLVGPPEPTPAEQGLSRFLVLALAAKRFVIFTGPSGTGKSRSALRLAEALQQSYASSVKGSLFQLVPVGPDWTSPKKLLGFRTPFGELRSRPDGSETNDSYEVTETLRMILRASHPDSVGVPHLLVFDEMNLSHVERYFAPFLSLIEASSIVDEDESAPLLDVYSMKVVSEVLDSVSADTAEAESARLMVQNNQPLRLPPNLAFIGTVNVDETTYMFSPKVLDRAHVIEVDAPRPSTYLGADATPMEVGGTISLDVSRKLLQSSIDDIENQRFEGSNPVDILMRAADEFGYSTALISAIRDRTVQALDGCHDLLKPVGFAFGFRTCKEVFSYIYVWLRASYLEGTPEASVAQGWEATLDRALVQKVLPKINGSRRVLSDSLKATASFLSGGHEGSAIPAKYATGDNITVGVAAANALPLSSPDALGESVSKLRSMHSQLIALGHTSFVL